jgi:putative toxin-antitoxin system antitoxin component (TIGR02293 family)
MRRRIYGEAIGLRTQDPARVVAKLRAGLPASCFERLRNELEVTSSRLAATVNIAPRTLARRRKEGRLHTDESERLLRIAGLYDRAVDVLGETTKARRWLLAPKRALGGVSPLDFADTEPGAEEVFDLLGRIEHGVFS